MADTQEADIVLPEQTEQPAQNGSISAEEAFVRDYQELCKKYKLQIAVVPNWVPRDDGSWSTVLKTGVSKLEK